MQDYKEALDLIKEYYYTEFNDFYEIVSLERIPLAYTTIEDDLDMQVYLDLIHLQLFKTIAGVVVETMSYKSLAELIACELTNLSFDGLITYTQEEVDLARSKMRY